MKESLKEFLKLISIEVWIFLFISGSAIAIAAHLSDEDRRQNEIAKQKNINDYLTNKQCKLIGIEIDKPAVSTYKCALQTTPTTHTYKCNNGVVYTVHM